MNFSNKARSAILICIFVVGIGTSIARKLPSFINQCSRTSQDLNECFRRGFEIVQPKLKNGLKELGIPNINPINIPYASLEQPNLNITLKDVNFYHVNNFLTNGGLFDFDNNFFEVNFTFPFLEIDFLYKLSGRIVILELNGADKGMVNLTNMDCHAKLEGKRETRNGKEYIQFHKTTLKFMYHQVSLDFNEIIPGNKELSKVTNQIINENGLDFVKTLESVILTAFESVIGQIVNSVFSKFSIDELFGP